MAGLSGLPYLIQYQGQLQEQQRAQQKAQQDLLTFQQAQQDRQRQQAALAAAGNALPALLAGGQPAAQGQMPPPPQPPAPGQPSQPAPQQAGGGVPLPPGIPPGLRPPLPPGGVQGSMPPAGVPPFRSMPTTPPVSASPQGAIPAPPASPTAATAPQQPQAGRWTLQQVVKAGQNQGLSGADLMDYVGQMTPLLDAQSKQQAAQAQQQFQHELQIATLQERHDAAVQASKDRNRSIDERTQAAATADQTRILIAQLVANTRRDVAGLGAPGAAASSTSTTSTTDGLPAPVGGGGLSGDAVRNLATRLKAGDAAALTGLSRPARAAVQNDLAKIDKGGGSDIAGNQIDFAAARRGAQAATQREANIATSEKAITNPGGLADQVLDAARKTYRTGSPFLNQKINYVLANYQGDPAVVDLKNALGDLEGQFNKAMAGGGVASDAARAETIARINDAQTLPQLEAAINRMKLGLRKEEEAAQETSKMFADRVRQAGKTGTNTAVPSGTPAVGTVDSGYRFKGGDPASPSSWERVQ